MAKTTLSQGELKRLIANLVNDLEGHRIRVERVVLYGSYAQGRPREFSDVDLAIISPSFARKGILKIQEELATAASKYLSISCEWRKYRKIGTDTIYFKIGY